MSFFLNSRNELRTGWKLSAFVIVLLPVWLATGFALTMAFNLFVGLGNPLHELALNVVISFIPAMVATAFAARIVEHAPLLVFGVGFHEGWTKLFRAGDVIAAGLILLLMLGSKILGQTNIEWTASQYTFSQAAITLGLLIVAAAFEELIFRGYPLQVLMKGIGAWPAMIAMSCLFGLLHAQNPNVSRLGIFNTIVAGMMLSLAYFKTRSLWFPYGLHLCWNIGLGMVVGFPLSGLSVASLWTTHVTGASWLVGGQYGPEGGALGTIVFLAGAFAVWKFPVKRIEYDDRLYKNSRAG
jgi:membrane protease YdiL (CAAX protease family)